MTQWSPEARKGEGKCVAPYYYGDKRVFGLRASHFMSGSCTQDFGSLTFVPLAGPVTAAAIEAGQPLDHREESARPFVYTLSAPEQGVEMEVTGTARAGLVHFRFRRGSGHSILVQSTTRPRLAGSMSIQSKGRSPGKIQCCESTRAMASPPVSAASSSFSLTSP